MNLFPKNKQKKINPELPPIENIEAVIDLFFNFLEKPISYEELREGEYALWLPCVEDQVFTKSRITKKWTDIYAANKTVQSYIAAEILRHFGLIEDFINRIQLPVDTDTIAIQATEGEHIIISFSQEKGIRFHFAESTAYNFRLDFLERFLHYCRAKKHQVDNEGWAQNLDNESAGWWESTVKVTANIEKNGPVEAVGKIF